MAGRRPAPEPEDVRAAVAAVLAASDAGDQPDAVALREAVKALTRLLAQRHPGRTVEVRIPPYAAVQCLTGPRHTRGTPPNVVEAEPLAWVLLCAGRVEWSELVRTGRVRASGERSDLTSVLPLV